MELVSFEEIPRKIWAGQKECREPIGGQPELLCGKTCLTNNRPHTECCFLSTALTAQQEAVTMSQEASLHETRIRQYLDLGLPEL